MQVENGIYRILANPIIYEIWVAILGSHRRRQIMRDEYIRPFPGMKILDIGCGPAEILNYLPDTEYFGTDLSEKYIEGARKKFGDRGEFAVQSADEVVVSGRKFDLVMALGLIHHLDDDECLALFRSAKEALLPNSRFITFDGVYTESQSRIARYFLDHDRGKNVRTEEEYMNLAGSIFGEDKIVSHVRTDITRIPYTHIVMECYL